MHFRIPEAPQGVVFATWVRDVIQSMLAQSWVGVDDDDHVAIEVAVPDNPRGVFHIPMVRKGDLHPDLILDRIEAMSQSNMELFLSGEAKVEFITAKMPRGEGRVRALLYCEKDKFVEHKYSMYDPPGDDNMCLVRAVAAGILWCDDQKKFNTVVRRPEPFRAEMRILVKESGVVIPPGGAGLAELQVLQRARPDYNIVLIHDRLATEFTFEGNPQSNKRVYLYLEENHYYVVKSVTGMIGAGYYCHECRCGFRAKGHHFCATDCRKCLQKGGNCPARLGYRKVCDTCKYTFFNEVCYERHKTAPLFTRDRPLCAVRQICATCGVFVNLRDAKPGVKHECGEAFCGVCRKTVTTIDHVCYMRRRETLLQKREAAKEEYRGKMLEKGDIGEGE
ncbi:hypothetical protein FOCC_FOCC014199 [Frankliniella occidentalis]|nr:hypothetical protein FOCC_FOCC014199 [Frankliniella occidentalis]